MVAADGFGRIARLFPPFGRLGPTALLFQKSQFEAFGVGRTSLFSINIHGFGDTTQLFKQESLPVKLSNLLPERKGSLPILHGFGKHCQSNCLLFRQARPAVALGCLAVAEPFEVISTFSGPL